ncbi:hypothetical protein AB0D83_38655 [Streptomyces decoyicus]|uniref:hypothetical protein n=1 Tax=Streptomyces decoyicus TaxID=249567 RepID=UPI0033DBDEAE
MAIRHRIAPLAARPASGQTTETAAADGTYLYFDKNQTNPARSTLSLMQRVPDARDTVLRHPPSPARTTPTAGTAPATTARWAASS